MASFMQQHFAVFATLCRLCGCFFIKNIRKNSQDISTVSWKSPYNLYSAICALLFVAFEVTFLRGRSFIPPGPDQGFSSHLLVLMHAILSVKVTVNFLSMAVGSVKLMDFFRKSAAFEQSTGFVRSEDRRRRFGRQPWPLLRRSLVVVTLVTSFAAGVYFFVGNFAESLGPAWTTFVAGYTFGSIAAVFFLLYDSLLCVCLTSCSEVLVEYVRFQLAAFDDCHRFRIARSESEVARTFQNIRLSLCSIKELKQCLNGVWRGALAATCTCMILMVCIVLYSIFQDGIYKTEVLITVCFSLYSSLSFIEMTYVSQSLIDEARDLKSATKAARTIDATSSYMHQLRQLHQAIEPRDMCLGSGFFRLDKPLLVSMTGSIITYTVILVQTSGDLSTQVDSVNATMSS